MPASLRGIEDVLPEMNHKSSAMIARVKTRFVVRRGRIGVGEGVGLVKLGREREKRKGGGEKTESVPVPVLRKNKKRFWLQDHRILTCPDDVRHLQG